MQAAQKNFIFIGNYNFILLSGDFNTLCSEEIYRDLIKWAQINNLIYNYE